MSDVQNIRMGEIFGTQHAGELRMTLGSCVGVFLFDPILRLAAAAHVVLPSVADPTANASPGKYADTAVPEMLRWMAIRGARLPRVTADLAGGGTMFAAEAKALGDRIGIGQSNIDAVLQSLAAHGVAVRNRELGGTLPRRVRFFVERGEWEVDEIARQPNRTIGGCQP